jgi:hypothetical protein
MELISGMKMDLSAFIAGLLFGVVGFVYWRYGKKREKPVMLWSGVALMVYPYVVSALLPVILVGLALVALPFVYHD